MGATWASGEPQRTVKRREEAPETRELMGRSRVQCGVGKRKGKRGDERRPCGEAWLGRIRPDKTRLRKGEEGTKRRVAGPLLRTGCGERRGIKNEGKMKSEKSKEK